MTWKEATIFFIMVVLGSFIGTFLSRQVLPQNIENSSARDLKKQYKIDSTAFVRQRDSLEVLKANNRAVQSSLQAERNKNIERYEKLNNSILTDAQLDSLLISIQNRSTKSGISRSTVDSSQSNR